MLGNMDVDLSNKKEIIKKDLNDLITSDLFGDNVVSEAISTLEILSLLSEEEILAALQKPHPAIRWNMLKALTKVDPHPRTIGLLVDQMLRPDVSPAMRSMIVKNIIHIKDPRIDEPLIALLQDDNPNVREHAALSLGERKANAAMTPLFQCLIDDDEMVRLAAGCAIGMLGDIRTVPFLLRARHDGDIRIQQVAQKALDSLGEKATPELVQVLRTKPMPLKNDALLLLKDLKDPRSVIAMIETLLDEELQEVAEEILMDMADFAQKPLLFVAKQAEVDPSFREKCLRLLIKMDSGDCIEALESMLDATSENLQMLAIQLLGELSHERSVDLLWKQFDRTLGGKEPLRAMLKTKEQVEKAPDPRFLPIEVQREESVQNQFLAELLLALGKQKDTTVVPSLLQGLEQFDSRVYSFSISALGHVQASEGVKPLCSIIDDKKGRYKELAVQTLAKIGDVKAVPFLRKVVQDVQTELEYRPDAPSSLASYAIQALAVLGDVQVVQMILTSWEDELEEAILSLGEVAVPQLIDALGNSPSSQIRLLSAEALGLLTAKNAMGGLISALQDRDEDVRNMAAWALNEIY